MKATTVALAAIGLLAASAIGAAVVANMTAGPELATLQVGTAAPDFRLTDVDGRMVQLSDFRGKPVVLEWNNPKCPFVRKHYDSGNMQQAQATATAGGAVWLTINSSAEGKQGHMTPAEAKAFVAGQPSRRTAYLLDPQGVAGRAYGAKTTPHMFIVSPDGALVYNGAIDDRPSNDVEDIPGARNHVLAALGELKAGKPISVARSQAYGCGVKYAAG